MKQPKLRFEMDSVPEVVDELERRIMQLEIEREAIKREKDDRKVNELSEEIANLSADAIRYAKWKGEKTWLMV
jgi:ATP-dependent Clp protease ATP-binding subunit ClpB